MRRFQAVNRKTALLLLFVFSLPALTGCFDYQEIGSMSVVMGSAIDGSTYSGNYVLTSEIAEISGESGSSSVKGTLLSSEGNTIYSAGRNSVAVTGKPLYYGHAKIVIVSQQIAQEGIVPVLDFVLRDEQSRITTLLLVSGQQTASEIFEAKPYNSPILSSEIEKILSSQKYLSQFPNMALYRLIDTFYQPGNCMVLPMIHLEETTLNDEGDSEMAIRIAGCAVFRDDKMIGSLSDADTKLLMFARDAVEGGTLSDFELGYSDDQNITLNILSSKTNVQADTEDGGLKMKLEIKIEASLAEAGNNDAKRYDSFLETIPAETEDYFASQVQRLIQKVQTNYGTDIFNFSDIIRSNHPEQWKEIEADWDHIFPTLPVEVTCKIELKDSEMATGNIRFTQ